MLNTFYGFLTDKMEPRRDRDEPEGQDDGMEATSIDDEEVEELHNSLKEVVQDPAVKPKFQCLMVDPSFSMVTVQSEDSGIVWETASSRCSTPWASEASSPSDTYSLEGSGTQGNIVIIMDEDKVKRKRKTSRGKLCDRFRRPGSRFSGSAIGEERPAMIEVSVPNVRSENSEDGQSAESRLDKDQELFNLVSEGFEILNIVVPSKLPTVDEETSTELADNLAYLEDTPKIKSKSKLEEITTTITRPDDVNIEIQEIKDERQNDLSLATVEEQPKKDETDMDYLEKFTLLDQHTPADESEKFKLTELIQQEEPQIPEKEQKRDETFDEESFVIISEVEIAGDHLDEVFYGAKCSAEPKPPTQPKGDEEDRSIKSLKECGSTLFGSQETILTPIFLPTGPPKIINQDLLDEPRALSFHYSDLYEDAVGDRKKDEDFSGRESVASEKSFKRRYSDSDDGDGYLEKFILKDDTPVVVDVPVVDTIECNRVIWPQSKFEMTGCLIRVKDENKPQEEEVGDSQSDLESKCNIEPQIHPPDSLGGHEDCDETKTVCSTATSVSKALADCQSCKTGSAIAEPVSYNEFTQKVDGTVNEQSDKFISIDDVVVEGKPADLPIPQEPDQETLTSAAINKLSFKNGLEEVHRVTDGSDEIQEPVVTNKDVSDKRQKDAPALTAVDQPQEDISLKELHVGKHEFTTEADILHKLSEETKLSGERTVVHDPVQHEITTGLLECKPVVPESKEILNLSEDTVDMSVLPESEKQEQVTNTAVTIEVTYKVSTEGKAEYSEDEIKLEGSEHKALEEQEVGKMDAAVKVETTEKKKMESETNELNRMESEDIPVNSLTAERNEMVDSSDLELVSDLVPFVLENKKNDLADGVEKVAKDSVVEGEMIVRKKMLANKDEHVEGDTTSFDSLQRLGHPDLEIKVIGLVQEVVNEDEGKKEEEVVGNEEEDSFKVSLSPSFSNEVTHRDCEDVAIDRNLTETTCENPEPVNNLARVDNSSPLAHVKDTHEEKIWRSLEYTTPSNLVDSSTVRVSPIDLPDSNREDEMPNDDGVFAKLRSFSPQEDLSRFGRELDLQKQTSEELSYEMVIEQEAREAEAEGIVGKEDFREHGQGQSPELSTEADYEFIENLDAAQLSELEQTQEKGDTEPVEAFCLVCQCPVLMSDGGHQNHEMTTPEKAFEDIKSQLNKWISVLQERAENVEDLVSELELAYNSVEEQCKDCEKALDEQNEEMLKVVMDRYNEMSHNMEEEKKAKLEKLYDQIVSVQENIDSAKEATDKTTMLMEDTDELTFVSSYEEVETRLKTALESTMSLELGPRGLLVFEDYAKGTTGNEKKNSQVIPVPQQPHLLPQGGNSATSNAVTVYWTVNEEDIIDCFQVYCMEEPQGAIVEEYRVTVKESYCNLEELEPDKCYKVWVMAVNYTGCSLPSERLHFRTAPSVPVINPETCTVLWDSAIIRWSSAQPNTAESFTLEYCRQYALEGEGLRSVSGIKGNQHKVLLTPNENFLFYIKSVNTAGASEQSEAALISTRGTRFHLQSETANRALKVSEDKNSVQYAVESYNEISGHTESPAVMGELMPRVGYHYWETLVAGCKAYRIGIVYQSGPHDSTVGDNSSSWCLHCVPTSISCRFELLHDSVESDIFVTVVPTRIGTLLDFTQRRLVFFNAQNGQCLGSFHHTFNQACYAVFALERPGNLELKMTVEVPEFAKHW